MTVTSSAAISDDSVYRYELTRRWSDGPTALWIMLNPSTADAGRDDPTIRRCIGFSKREGMGSLAVVNLFALRSVDPSRLLSLFDDVEGPLNESYLRRWLRSRDVSVAIAAWGAHQVVKRRKTVAAQVIAWAGDEGRTLHCLGKTKAGGYPRHPLYVRADAPLEVYR